MQEEFNSSYHKTSTLLEAFTGQPGSYVPIKDTVPGFKGIIDGLYDDIPEDMFRNVGPIEDVIKKLKQQGFMEEIKDG